MALTLTTSAEIIRRAGAGASSTITGSGALIIEIGENAEGELVSDTRRDWITDYTSVNTSVKKLVSNAVAAKAAFKIVSYDASGYYSRLEQETLLDILSDEYARAVNTLALIDANDIRSVTE